MTLVIAIEGFTELFNHLGRGALLHLMSTQPTRLAAEHRRRRDGLAEPTDLKAKSATKRVAAVRRSIERLINSYQDGSLEKEDFEPRSRGLHKRLIPPSLQLFQDSSGKVERRDQYRARSAPAMSGLNCSASLEAYWSIIFKSLPTAMNCQP
ncbi:hypothetical protein BH23PLA1_BH23PLA1_21010 [soil metagenome]